MKLPRNNIFWECICNNYLTIQDMARFEASIDNHLNRKFIFGLSSFDDNGSPYETMIHISESQVIPLFSNEMKIWCEKRRLFIPNMKLLCNPSSISSFFLSFTKCSTEKTENSFDYSWDLMNRVKRLEISSVEVDLVSLLPRLCSVTSFTAVHYDDSLQFPLTESSISLLINQYQQNQSFLSSSSSSSSSFGLQYLTSLTLNIGNLDRSSIISLIKHIPTIKSFHLKMDEEEYNSTTSSNYYDDKFIQHISQHWNYLQDLAGRVDQVTNNGLKSLILHGQKFHTIKFAKCSHLSSSLIDFIQFSSDTLTHLNLRLIGDHMRSILPVIILPLCPNLTHLETDACSDTTLKGLAKYCPHIISIKLHRYHPIPLTDTGIDSLISGCKNIQELYFEFGRYLSDTTLQHLANGYRNTLRKVIIRNSLILLDRTIFQDCQYRVDFSYQIAENRYATPWAVDVLISNVNSNLT